MWQFILIILSASLFFGFVIFNIIKFGLLNCYSAYGEKWQNKSNVNIWSIITILSALLIIPVLLEQSENSTLQFTGFLAPVSLVLVGITPEYNKKKLDWWLHQIGAWSAVLMIVLYVIFIPHLLWIVIVCLLVAITVTCIFGWNYITLFSELGIYAAIYAVVINTISNV